MDEIVDSDSENPHRITLAKVNFDNWIILNYLIENSSSDSEVGSW